MLRSHWLVIAHSAQGIASNKQDYCYSEELRALHKYYVIQLHTVALLQQDSAIVKHASVCCCHVNMATFPSGTDNCLLIPAVMGVAVRQRHPF